MALTLQWWLIDTLTLFLPESNDNTNENTKTALDHFFRLWSGPIASESHLWDSITCWLFLIMWSAMFLLGGRVQRILQLTEGERLQERQWKLQQWFQDQLRKAPRNCDRVPRWPGTQHRAEDDGDNGDHTDGRQVSGTSEDRDLREEEDFGMYLLPKDLESMKLKRAKSIPCFSTRSQTVIPLRQSSLPVAAVARQSHSDLSPWP